MVSSTRFRLLVLLLFIAVVAFTGGVFRAEAMGLLVLRPVAIIALALLIVSPGAWRIGGLKPLFVLLLLFASWMLLQLVPLPPAVWAALPGHQPYAQADEVAGLGRAWRPLSLYPDGAINGLLSLLPPCVILVGMASIPRTMWPVLFYAMLLLCAASAVLAFAQWTGDPGSLFYPYRDYGARDDALGFFANRNHQALLLALVLPMLAFWAALPADGRTRYVRYGIALGGSILTMIFILLTQSRAGLVLAVMLLLVLLPLAPSAIRRRSRWWSVLLGVAPLVMAAAGAVIARQSGYTRLIDTAGQLGADRRLEALPIAWRMAVDFLPLGAGQGAFEHLFYRYEPDAILAKTYMNHAHNDFVELLLTGGLPALALLAAFLGWFLMRAIAVFRTAAPMRMQDVMARAAVVMIAAMLGASLIDYPLRTPLMAIMFTMACSWLVADRRAGKSVDTSRQAVAFS